MLGVIKRMAAFPFMVSGDGRPGTRTAEPALNRRGLRSEEIIGGIFLLHAPDALDCCWILSVVW